MAGMNDLYGKSDRDFFDFLLDQGYRNIRKLPDGEFVATKKLAYTTAVCSGMDFVTSHKYRWCFSEKSDAVDFVNSMVDYDEIPKNTSSLMGHRYHSEPLLVLYDERGFARW